MSFYNYPKKHLYLLTVIAIILFSSHASLAAEVDFSWLPNTESNLAGYKIHFGVTSGSYMYESDVNLPTVIDGRVQASIDGLSEGTTYYFAATAYDTGGFESDFSDEVVLTTLAEEPVAQPQPPLAHDVSLSLFEDSAASVQLDGQSLDGHALTYHIVENGSRGTGSIPDSAVGALFYTPAEDIYGTDSLQYKVSDASGESSVATVHITITAVNDRPSAQGASFSTSEDITLSGTLLASDIDGDNLVYSVVGFPSAGVLNITDSASGSFVYTPQENISGSDSFTFQVSDEETISNIAMVQLDVSPVNDSPTADDGTVHTAENTQVSGILQGNDIDSSSLIFSIVANGALGTATITDSASGMFIYTPAADTYGEDSFRFIVSDGNSQSSPSTMTVEIQQAAHPFAMEVGEISVDGTWIFVPLTETFGHPVVVAKPASNNDPDPCVVRIRNVSSDGFEIRLQNYDYLAVEHGLEQIGYIAMEQGSFTLDNGKRVEAGLFTTDINGSLKTISFAEPFPVMPAVAASIVSANESDAVVSRVETATENGFAYQMQEQEANSAEHMVEDVAYIAWEPFSGIIGNVAFEIQVLQGAINDQWLALAFQQGFDRTPVLVAEMQSQYGQDTANLRQADLQALGVHIKVAEEQSLDDEISHGLEDFSFIAISAIDLATDADNDGLITQEERDFYGTSPGTADTDGDGLSDGEETDFWGSGWEQDSDNDGVVNLLDPDSDNDGYLDGEEVMLGFDPADSSSNPDTVEEPVVSVIELEVNAQKIKGNKTVEIFWSGAAGSSVEISRIRDNNETFAVTVPNENYYFEILIKSGTYTYQVCETDGSACSDRITVSL